ncbi:MAG TPA: tetraacyldisaccharide 4'-kinase [Burkholderiales bacterium]|nr:tetraacyldisaccharide 4'-kinase [Burkholderiales bacterium]
MRHWQRVTPLSAALYPVSLVFGAVAALRRALYANGILRSQRVGAPVVVVGNIYVGGTGKTPLVLWLARFLAAHGRRPGIVSRGYGGSAGHPSEVRSDADPARVGDEPLLLARRSGCPVWTGRDRVAAARALLAAHPACDVVISDDGLQHYRLAREVEIAVIDGARRLGNGLLLPAGPLREPASRLETVDAVVVNGESMKLVGSRFHNLRDPQRTASAEDFRGKRVVAVAGIGHPPRFFAHLKRLGIEFEPRAFPDHHAYKPLDIAFEGADAVVMTEKDAVKCAAFASDKHWMLPVEAELDARLGELVLSKIRSAPKP